MKRITILPIMLIMFSLAAAAQPECTDGMAVNIQGGESFECHFTQCVGLIVDIAIDPWQNMTPSVREYNITGCTNVAPFPAQSTPYPNTIQWACPCTDDYNFTLTTNPLSNGTYHITFNQTIIEYWPVFNSTIANQTIQETELLTVTLSAYDNDTAQSNLTYSTDASFGSMAGNVYTWQTDYNSEGTYNITFFVTDGTYTDNETITLIVTHKDPPTPPPDSPPDDEGTGGGGGGGGSVSTCGDGVCSGFEGCDTCEMDCGVCEEEEVTEEEAEVVAETPAEGPEATGLEGITGGAAGNLTGEDEGMGGITGAVIGALNKPAFKVIGSLLLLVLLILLGLYIYDRRKRND